MATELGILGGLTYLFLIGFISVRLIIVLRGSLDEDMKYIFKGILLGWLGLLGHLQTEPMAYEGTLWLILALIEGATIVTLAGRRSRAAMAVAPA